MINLINDTIEAIRADAGKRLKMDAFCSQDDDICNTSFCLAGWMVVSQFSKDEILREIYSGDIKTWNDATSIGLLDDYIQEKAYKLIEKEFGDLDPYDLFYLYIADDALAHLAIRLGVLNHLRDFRSNRIVFDMFPQQVRKDAAIKVLEILRDTKEIRWLDAINYAVKKYEEEQFGCIMSSPK